MPRPRNGPSSLRFARHISSKNDHPLRSWLSSRKHHQRYLEDEAVCKITGKNEDNTRKLMDELNSVDFIHSDLPERILSDYVYEHPICRMEWDTRALIALLQTDRQNINMDIRPIDEKLMTLVLMLKQFVAYGVSLAARMALDALTVGILDIRCKLPVHQPELADDFVRENAGYLEQWITLTGIAETYDFIECFLKTENAALLDAENRRNDRAESVANRIETEVEFAEAFFYVFDHDTPTDRLNWNKTQRKVHALIVDAKMQDCIFRLHMLLAIALETHLVVSKQEMESLRTFLNQLPIVSAPSMMDQYRMAMYQFLQTTAESDARTEETFDTIDPLIITLDTLNNFRSTLPYEGRIITDPEAVMERVQTFLKKFERKPEENGLNHFRNLRDYGWLTKEELERQMAENEALLKAELLNQEAADQE